MKVDSKMLHNIMKFHNNIMKYHNTIINYHHFIMKYHHNIMNFHHNNVKYHHYLMSYDHNILNSHLNVTLPLKKVIAFPICLQNNSHLLLLLWGDNPRYLPCVQGVNCEHRRCVSGKITIKMFMHYIHFY